MDKNKNIIISFSIFLITLLSLILFLPKNNDPIISWVLPNSGDAAPMPLVQDTSPYTVSLKYASAPYEQRGPEFRKYLSASLKILVSGASGSGTIIYYDPFTNDAYVMSCGHLWNGNRSAAELKRNPVQAKVMTWYHNDTKLNEPKTYSADVLYWSNTRGFDTSLLKFKPDWKPNFFPVAPVDHPIRMGDKVHQTGCDGGREVAHYEVELVEYRGNDLITKFNTARPGRSGGSTIDNTPNQYNVGYYIAVVWGTSDRSGNSGIGYNTPLSSIHKVAKENGYEWVVNIKSNNFARKIPIIDFNNKSYPNDLIPLPNNDRILIPN